MNKDLLNVLKTSKNDFTCLIENKLTKKTRIIYIENSCFYNIKFNNFLKDFEKLLSVKESRTHLDLTIFIK